VSQIISTSWKNILKKGNGSQHKKSKEGKEKDQGFHQFFFNSQFIHSLNWDSFYFSHAQQNSLVFSCFANIFYLNYSQKGDGSSSSSSIPSMPTKVWQPGVDNLEEGEELECDPTAYNSLHAFHIGWPCLRLIQIFL
jgi:hypothetical protein